MPKTVHVHKGANVILEMRRNKTLKTEKTRKEIYRIPRLAKNMCLDRKIEEDNRATDPEKYQASFTTQYNNIITPFRNIHNNIYMNTKERQCEKCCDYHITSLTTLKFIF